MRITLLNIHHISTERTSVWVLISLFLDNDADAWVSPHFFQRKRPSRKSSSNIVTSITYPLNRKIQAQNTNHFITFHIDAGNARYIPLYRLKVIYKYSIGNLLIKIRHGSFFLFFCPRTHFYPHSYFYNILFFIKNSSYNYGSYE